MAERHLTPRQEKWFASVQGNPERDTGRGLAEWVAIAKTCPETTQRGQLAWLKAQHGLLMNRAIFVLSEAFGADRPWEDPDALIDALWVDPASRAILGLAVAPGVDDALIPRRKSEALNERLLAIAPLASAADVDGRIEGLLRQAWERS